MRIAQLIKTSNLARLGPEIRAGREPLAPLQIRIAAAFSIARLSAPTLNLIRSAVLLWHDHLDESHAVSQEIESPDGSFLHGIMHRREPDYSNAKYWFHRVGMHASFPEIARRVNVLLDTARSSTLKNSLLTAECWDCFAMVDAVERSARKGNATEETRLLQRIQQIEFEVLLERFCAMG